MWRLWICYLLLLAARPAVSQQVMPVPGQRVMVTHRCLLQQRPAECGPGISKRAIEGVLEGVDAHSVRILAGEEGKLSIPVEHITAWSVSTGTRSRWTRGAVVGGVAGSVLGILVGSEQESCFFENCRPKILEGILLGAPLGALLGGLIGSVLRTEAWQPMPVPAVAFAARPDGVRVSIRLVRW